MLSDDDAPVPLYSVPNDKKPPKLDDFSIGTSHISVFSASHSKCGKFSVDSCGKVSMMAVLICAISSFAGRTSDGPMLMRSRRSWVFWTEEEGTEVLKRRITFYNVNI